MNFFFCKNIPSIKTCFFFNVVLYEIYKVIRSVKILLSTVCSLKKIKGKHLYIPVKGLYIPVKGLTAGIPV